MKKDEIGRLVFKKGFFMKKLWGGNSVLMVIGFLMRGDSPCPNYPKNLCTLFWGTVLSPLVWTFAFLFAFPLLVFLGFYIYLVVFFFGHMPVLTRKEYHLREAKKWDICLYHPYKRYGKDDEKKILFAPWQILLFLMLGGLIAKEIRNNFSFLGSATNATYSVITSYALWIIIGIVGLVIGLSLFFCSTAWKVTREYLKAKKEKMCPLITFEEKQKT